MASRRGHGEGAIYQRKSDGKWCCAVELGWAGGKRDRNVIYGKTRKEVAEKLKVIHRDQQQGLPVAVERQTVEHFLSRWLTDVVEPTTRPRTAHSYAQVVRLYIIPAIGRIQLAKLDPQHIQTMLNNLRVSGGKDGRELSARTVAYARGVLRKALNQAVKWGQVARNVATLVDAPRAIKPKIKPLTPTQAAALLDAAHGDRLEALYGVALSLGLRKGEALGLRWEDVDLDVGELRVTQAIQRVSGKLRAAEPKTEQSRRTLPIPTPMVRLLRAHRTRQKEARLAAGQAWQDHGLVFTTTIGTPIEPRNLSRSFKALLQRAGLPDVRFHDLRHSCASLLIAQGVHPRTVMEILGHSQISLTMNVYGHVLPDAQRAAIATMATLFPIEDVGD